MNLGPVCRFYEGQFLMSELIIIIDCTACTYAVYDKMLVYLRIQKLSRRSRIGVEKTNTMKSLTGIIFSVIK